MPVSNQLKSQLGLSRILRSISASGVLAVAFAVLACGVSACADHVHHLYYNNSQWQDEDLTSLTGGGIATSFGAITAFYTTPNQQFHVYYVDANSQHVHQLYYNNTSWSDSDLTSLTGGPAASAFGISGFALGNFQFVFYEGMDNHVHGLEYLNNWSDHDLTALANGSPSGLGPILAFATKPNNQVHVYFQTQSSADLYQLYYNGKTWSQQDLTSIAGAYCYSDWLSGLAIQNQQHIFCPGFGSSGTLDMLHIYYNNSTWVYEDISTKVGGAPLSLGSGVASFLIPGTKQGAVYGVTDDAHMHQYYFDKTWTDLDLTRFLNAPSDPGFGGIIAFPTTPNDQLHVYYQPSSEVYQLYFDGSNWSDQDLTGGTGQADDNSGMAGFALGNLQHVFYLGTGN